MPLSLLVGLFFTVAAAGSADAEIVFFSTGRTLNVKEHRTEGDSLVLALRGGGEIVCNRELIVSIEPDEVPYPELEPTRGAEAPRETVSDSPAELHAKSRYEPIIRQASARYGIDAKLVRAVIQVESGYQPRARSAKGAIGLMQLLPATGRQYGVRDLYDPASNVEAGIKHLKSLLERFPLTLALAAYNAGEAAVQRFGGIPPYTETQNYVARIVNLVSN